MGWIQVGDQRFETEGTGYVGWITWYPATEAHTLNMIGWDPKFSLQCECRDIEVLKAIGETVHDKITKVLPDLRGGVGQ